jgi:uncharacterized protein (DUF58 family)
VRQTLARVRTNIQGWSSADRVLYRYQGDDRSVELRAPVRWPFLMLLVLAALMIALPARIWVVTFSGLAVALGASTLWALLSARRVRFARRVRHAWTQVGDRLEEVLTLDNDSPLPLLAAEIIDHSDLPGYTIGGIRAIEGSCHGQWREVGISRRRGLFRLGPTTLRFGDPLGLFTITCHYPYSREVLVFPPVLDDLDLAAPSGGGHGAALSRRRSLDETAAIGGVRDYVPGDPIRRIHWPLTARHQMFLVKEFDREMGGDTWIVLDLQEAVQAGQDEQSTIEYGVIWAASWAWRLLREGKGVGLFMYAPARTLIAPVRGTGHLWTLLRALAPAEAETPIPLAELLREIRPTVQRGDALVIITPSLAQDWPERLVQPGLQMVSKQVLLLDAETFRREDLAAETVGAPATSGCLVGAQGQAQGRPLQESPSDAGGASAAGMRSLLLSMGVRTHLIQRRERLSARPAAPGAGDWEMATTPWGSVVVRSRPAEVRE